MEVDGDSSEVGSSPARFRQGTRPFTSTVILQLLKQMPPSSLGTSSRPFLHLTCNLGPRPHEETEFQVRSMLRRPPQTVSPEEAYSRDLACGDNQAGCHSPCAQ